MIRVKAFQAYLSTTNYAEKTRQSYVESIKFYKKKYRTMDMKYILAFKAYIINKNKTQTINLRLRAINCYNEWDGHPELHVTFVKVPKKMFLEDVLSEADYKHLCRMLKRDGKANWYFLVRFLACTGARIGEALKFKGEHIVQGYMDIYGKGGKQRRIWIPKHLQKEALQWKTQGILWEWNSRVIESTFRQFGKEYKIDPKTMHPHAFRALFARLFYARTRDIQMLSNLMGHDSVNTTMIYLLRTNTEMVDTINNVVTW